MSNKKKVYVVPHSHWDREWYFTIEDSNVLLTQNMPYLMNVLETDETFSAYTFDAQLSIVDEYLKLYPEDKERLQKLVTERKLFVGPWYTQTDSLLVHKESIIRNLLYGTRLGDELGHSMRVGYLPDIFGQNQYLPSIFSGFDIQDSVVQRGLYNDQIADGLNFTWTSPDGKSVRANNIFLGYGPGKFLAADDTYINEKLIPMLQKLEEFNGDCDHLLLPAGGDQVLVREHFPQTIKALNEKQDQYEFILSNYEDFMKDTWKQEHPNAVEGELIASQKSRIHNTIKSQRYDIKKANYDIENKILYVLEPLLVMGKSLGLKYPTPWLDNVWKALFDAHAHDSIGGCNSDDTNKDIMTRLEKANRICDNLINITKKQITEAISKKVAKDNIFIIFNTNVQAAKQNYKGVIFSKNEEIKIQDLSGQDVVFTSVNREYLSGGKQVMVTAEGEKEVELPGYYRHEVMVSSVEVAAMGYETLVVVDAEDTQKAANKVALAEGNSIENEYFEVTFEEGNIVLRNKVTNECIKDLLYFEESEDCGDSYDYSPSATGEQTIIKDAQLVQVEKSPLVSKMTLRHEALGIITTLELTDKENFVKVSHTLTNEQPDHRVRVVLNTNLTAKTSLSDQGFGFIERSNENPYLENWRENGFAEAPVPIFALENMVALKEGDKVHGVIAKGIKEYEILEDSKIALTLFRSVGLLGKDDLLWRPGRASGINNKVVYTEDAQMMQKMHFEYAITMLDGQQPSTLFTLMDQYVERYATYHRQKLNLFEERLERFEIPLDKKVEGSAYSLFEMKSENVFASVTKESYDKEGMIVRLFNPSNEAKIVEVNAKATKMYLTNLYERVLEEVKGTVTVLPNQYITLKLVF